MAMAKVGRERGGAAALLPLLLHLNRLEDSKAVFIAIALA